MKEKVSAFAIFKGRKVRADLFEDIIVSLLTLAYKGWGYSRPLRRPGGGGRHKSLWVLHTLNPCMDFHQIFRVCLF